MRSLSLLVFICFAVIAHVSYADDAATDAAKPAAESTPPADPQHEDFDEAQEHSGDANFNGDDSPSHSDLSEESTDNVKALSPEDFETHVGKDTPVLVEFYAPWCGHCQELAPHYEKLSPALIEKGHKVLVTKVNADKHSALADKYTVEAFPTIRWFPSGSLKPSWNEFLGEHSTDALVQYVEEQLKNQGTAAAQKEWEAKNPEPEDKGTGFGDDADLDSDQMNSFLSEDDDDAFLRSLGLDMDAEAPNKDAPDAAAGGDAEHAESAGGSAEADAAASPAGGKQEL